MLDLSPFQTLPLHIAEAIVRYCIGLQRHRHKYTFHVAERTAKTWRVLHSVSRSWMQLARRNLNERVNLNLSTNPTDDEFTTTLHSRRVVEQRTAITPHVKRVDIRLYAIVEEPNEEYIDMLSRVWPEDLVFPKARSLRCYLVYGCAEVSDNARNDRHFKWFVERVRSSFPNLQETTIEFGECGMITISTGVLFSKEWDASLFTSALFGAALWDMDMILGSPHMDNDNALIKHTPALTSFTCHEYLNYESAGRIIKKSAATLEKLHYGGNDGGGFTDFMFDDDGQVVVYPRLRDFYIQDYSDDKGEFTTDKSIVPFPVLQHLKARCNCIFKDDTLFRRPNNTLVSLDLELHRGFADIFRKYKAFSQGAYPNIIHITVYLEKGHDLSLPDDEYTEAAFSLISPATQSMRIDSETSYQCISSVIPTCPYLENIQILSFARTKLSLLEMLDIFKHFPHVTDFSCSFRGIDSELHAIQDKLIPSHLASQYSQLISRLKCWRMYYSERISHRDIGVLFVSLVVLCPNLTFVDNGEQNRTIYARVVGYVLSCGLYDQHAERLGNLLCDELAV